VQQAMSDPSHVVIAVMGMTGVGKSSFIQRVTNQNDILVEDSLSSGEFIIAQRTNPSLNR
jgi:GTP-binding protein EngB required for normal cell division